ncbi:MAG: ribosome-associated translation inhibitor RaiA [Gammaproteobacteria bacterium]|nr:ribosome-associated translation inhibitor RaiA [Gammaproteobacteria bacterium]
MQLAITGNRVEVNNHIRNTIQKKLSRLQRHYDHITSVRVILSVDKIEYCAEATVHVNGNELFANSRASDIHTAVDSLVDKLDRQVIKHKEKSTRHR